MTTLWWWPENESDDFSQTCTFTVPVKSRKFVCEPHNNSVSIERYNLHMQMLLE